MPSWCWASREPAAAVLTGALLLSSANATAEDHTRPQPVASTVSPTPQQPQPPPGQPAPAARGTPGEVYQEQLLVVDINSQHLDQAVLVLRDGLGMFYLRSQDIQAWRLRPLMGAAGPAGAAGVAAVVHRNETFIPLSTFPGAKLIYDATDLTLAIELRAQAFEGATLTARQEPLPPPVRSGPGGFFNYDVLATMATGATQQSGLFELGYFNASGVGTLTLLAQSAGQGQGQAQGQDNVRRFTRLDTTWSVDLPDHRRTWHIGDAITVPGSWGRAVRFGGIQVGTNFGTQPGFITAPAQSVAGQALAQSTVDVLINHALVSRQTVPPGPFSIGHLPVVSGAGEVQVVVRDLLGREQIITQPFYANQTLLSQGLAQDSVEFGFVRQNHGTRSNDYSHWLASGTRRQGISDTFTAEVHAQAMPGQVAAGVGGDVLVPHFGTFSTHLAGSWRKDALKASATADTPPGLLPRHGGMLMVGIDRQTPTWSVGAHTQWTSSGFSVDDPSSATTALPMRTSSLGLSLAAGRAGTLSLVAIGQHHRHPTNAANTTHTWLATLSYSLSLGRLGSLSVAVQRQMADDAATAVFALLSMPLSASTHLSTTAQTLSGTGGGSGRVQTTTTLQRQLPMGEGHGYRLQTRSDHSNELALALQNNVGTYTWEAVQSQGTTAQRWGASGGVAFLGGDAFLSRRIDQSFAVVRIPDYPNVRVLADNQPSGRTDAQGNALIPRLRAYDTNVISVDQRDIPMDATIGAIKLKAVPFLRSGLDVTFPIERSHGATLTLMQADGMPLPVGATVQALGRTDTFTVGYGGQVYVVGLGPTNRLRASWLQQRCESDVTYTPSADPMPDLGPFICKAVPP